MGMETMHLVQTPHTTDLMSLSDSALEAFFASDGLTVEVVAHCNASECSVCHPQTTVRAA
jgi:hypothetical protein